MCCAQVHPAAYKSQTRNKVIDVKGGQAILLVIQKMGRKDRKNLTEPVCLHSPLVEVVVRCFMLDKIDETGYYQ